MQNPSSNPDNHDGTGGLQWSDAITQYDEAHLFTYAQLLDAAAAGASRSQMIESILGLDSRHAASEAQLSLHLKRAQWIRTTGYCQLLSQ